MRVLYTSDIFARQAVGGISRYFVELIRELLRNERVDVDLSVRWHINEHLRELQETEKVAGRFLPKLRSIRHFLPAVNALPYWSSSAGTDSPQIIHHTYYSWFQPSTVGGLVVTAHDVMPELFWNRSHPRTKGLLLAKRRSLEAADRIIAVSQHTKNDIIDIYDLEPDVIDVIPHGNPMAEFSKLSTVSLEVDDVSRKGQRPYLLYVGARGGYKNWEAFIDAFAASEFLRKEFRIVCFGGGPLGRAERELLEKLRISSSVTQESGDDHALAKAYCQATAIVYPSRYEGFGLPPLEAMSCGCPVICSDAASIPEVVGGAGVYFDADDLDSIRSAMESTLGDSAKLKRLRQAGLEREKQFRWRTTAELTLASYEQAIGLAAPIPSDSKRAAA
ncbi:glycosyltransferase family 4 protein [Thalassoroseus pseudoceratinae]|uniref:glycosyltransferase family 4 protein n=1 Tax=Thalassoroseus pseudoceratinae TaxID=2713176 RepID=UPI001421717A|nr:glycosyltransferase family 1 protein [Thalassoroseus pseudoceratinae]